MVFYELEAEYHGSFTDDLESTPHRSGLPVAEVWAGESFPGCTKAPLHLLTLDLAAIDGVPEELRAFGLLPVVHTSCGSCDAWLMNGKTQADPFAMMTFERLADGRLRAFSPERYRETCSGGEAFPAPKPQGVVLQPGPGGPVGKGRAIQVGGEPVWVQGGATWALCSRCGGDCSFVVQLDLLYVPQPSGGNDQVLYVFVCGGCQAIVTTTQLT